MTRYTFGDDLPASRRLELVAAAYEQASRAFLAEHAPTGAAVAIDIGCGPGFSTRLLHDVCRPRTLIGLDSSSRFLDDARAQVPTARFQTHDATTLPMPGPPATLMYARLVLAHLPDPLNVVRQWKTALAPGGVMCIEDLETIQAPPGPLRDYDEVAAEIVQAAGGRMYAGPELASLGGQCVPVTVPAALAATIYLFNVNRWLADTTMTLPHHRLRDLQTSLRTVTNTHNTDTVSWIVRQLTVHG